MLASDVNNPQFAGSMDPDSVMVARFYKKAIRNNFLSEKEGRPIFNDVIYCEYYPAGSTLLRMDVPARDQHKQRFAKQWAYFQSTQKDDGGAQGTPLSEWAILSPADVENLRGAKFSTIENVAGASDALLQSMGMGVAGMAPYVLRARAQAYLGTAKDTALPQAQAQELIAMREQNEELKRQMDELRAMIQKHEKVDKRKREFTPEERDAMAERLRKGREKAAAAREAQKGA